MPVSADHRLLRRILRLCLILQDRNQCQVHHALKWPDQLMKQFFFAPSIRAISPASFVSIVRITNCSCPLHMAAFVSLPHTFYFKTSPASQLQRSRGIFRNKSPLLDTYSNPRSPANHNSDRPDFPSSFQVPRYQARLSRSPRPAPCPPPAPAAHARPARSRS